MKLLYSSQDRVLLYLIKARLDDKGIASFFKNEQPPLAGEIPPMIAWPQLWVMEESNYARATECVTDELASRSTTHAVWTCPQCQEKLEGQFEICWKCGFARN